MDPDTHAAGATMADAATGADVALWAGWIGGIGLAVTFLVMAVSGGRLLAEVKALREDHTEAECARRRDMEELRQFLAERGRTISQLIATVAGLSADVVTVRRDTERLEQHLRERRERHSRPTPEHGS